MNALFWITAVASMAGVWLNIKKHPLCFWIWSFTNATWAVADATHGLLPQAIVQTCNFCFSIYGIVQWSRDGKKDPR